MAERSSLDDETGISKTQFEEAISEKSKLPEHSRGTFLVTGAAGFIGSHVCEALIKRGDSVIGIDSFNEFYDPALKRGNIENIEKTAEKYGEAGANFRNFKGDIRDKDFLDRIFSTYAFDGLIHLAAYAGVRPSIADPQLYTDVNIMGTVNLLECLKKYGINRHVFASSSSVYGNNKKVPFHEDDPVDRAISPYAATKKAGEVLCYTYHHLYSIHTACLRFFTVYGPRQRPDLAIHKFTRMISRGEALPFFGDGSMRRDHTYIDDIIDGTLKALDWTGTAAAAPDSHGDSGKELRYGIFNLGESHTITLSELVRKISQALGKEARIDRKPVPPGDVECTYADISRAQEVLGYAPSTDLDQGLAQFVQWYRSESASAAGRV